MSYILYGCPETAAFGAHAVLEEAGLDYTMELVNIRAGESHKPEYLAINPAGYVPALKLEDGQVMYEVAAIMLYLAEHHGLKELAPGIDEPERALFLRTLFYLTNTVQEAYKQYYNAARFTTDEKAVPQIREKALELQAERWHVIEDALKKAGPYALGKRFSLLDIYVTMLASWHPDPAVFYARFPAIKKCRDLVVARPRLARVVKEHAA